MLPALAAATTAIDALQALTKSKSKAATTTTGVTQKTASPFDVASTSTAASATSSTATSATSSTNSSYKLAPGTMSTLLDAQSQPATAASEAKRADSLKRLMGMLDSDGSGGISKAEFEKKLGAGGTNTANADKVFAELDKNVDGSVNIDELSPALNGGKAHHAGGGMGGGSGGGSDTAGSTTTTTVNADGSTTTSIAYADGSTVSSTTAVPTSSTSSTASSSYNAIEKMIARQAQQISNAKSTLAISA
ncbi:EF-hand domain-containing protein [Tardiphaga robiniae]|uniref:EF-hand domain-containing protein n=1 Tax=Tardiphaga robiniae TaxID=943830 RepID=A0A7G6TZB8_9BRAD|nr:EF-hand domain-containing protein [Tardiphaga robiniae]QND72100.1 EF-hand domain-containing protein [Tardiphaga robiniae]